ncbi:MAG: YbaB/EbfC family nucleoid-associated protein [Anaerolineae bacterium]
MGSGFSKMKKQARVLEEQFEKMREELKSSIFTGSSGNGLVTVVLNGEKELKEIKIKPECIDPNDVEGLQDLIKAALEDAYRKVNDKDSGGLLDLLPH